MWFFVKIKYAKILTQKTTNMKENNENLPYRSLSQEEGDKIFGKYKSYDDYFLDPDQPYAMVKVFIDGNELKAGFTVEFTQKTNDHDTFKIITPDDSFDAFEKPILDKSRHLPTKNVTIQFARFGKIQQIFEGIITNIKNPRHEGGGYGDLHLMGSGNTILLETGKDCQSFENKTLAQIINEICERYPSEAKIKASDNYLNLTNRNAIPYTVQYKESDYEFIKRLAKRHGEFFYNTSEGIVFGNKVQPIVELNEGEDLIEEIFSASLQAQDFKFLAYDAESGTVFEKDSRTVKSEFKENHFGAMSVIASRKLFTKNPVMQFGNAKNQWELDEAVRLEKERLENLFFVKGKSRAPELKIGGRAEMKDINGKAMETYRIIEIRHYHDGFEYYNEFIGIPDLFNASPFIDTEAVPFGEIQSARVMDNNDPKKMGRVRVQFPWQMAKNQMTPWLRITTLYAGADKGMYMIPEIGEEVLVAYESNNAEKPFVLGALYNGAETSGYGTADNDLKVIKTRSGIEQVFNDAEGSWKQSTPDGNFIYQDGQNNTIINAVNDLTINVGGNFNINVGKNVTFLVGLKAIYNIGVQMMMNTPILKYFVADNYHLQSPKTLINGDGEIKIEGKETNVAGIEKLLMHSDTTATVNSMGLVNVKGQDGTSHTNTPTSYEMAKPEITAKCIVHFRPKKDWKGIGYGFDYMRKGDTSLIFGTADFGDVDYETIISKQYTDSTYTTLVTDGNKYNGAFKVDPTKFNLLKNTYNVHNIPWKAQKDSAGADLKDSAGNIIPEEYFCSWLSLYPSKEVFIDEEVSLANKSGKPIKTIVETGFTNTTAVISLIVDIEEEPDTLRFEDNEYFTITPKEVSIKGKGKGKHAFVDHITITCLQEFTTDQTLVINAVKKDSTGKEELLPAGKIMVWANNSTKRKKSKVLLIDVTTNILATASSQKSGNPSGQEALFNSYLKQALINADVSTENLNLSTDSNLQTGGTYIHNNLIKCYYDDATAPSGFINIQTYIYQKLKDQLKTINPLDENKYDSHYIMIYLGESGGGYKAAGHVNTVAGYSSGKFVVMFPNRTPQTGAHELLHSFNLPHSFSNKECIGVNGSIFTYEYAKTENILDYSHRQFKPRYSLWHWQWVKANNSIR